MSLPVVRFARKADKEQVMKFVTNTWSWGDYIPEVWDAWLIDKTGRMFVVEVDGKVVGMNHIRLLDEGVGWLEGVRIHPEYRRMGLATLLGETAMNYARTRGIRRFRLLSSVTNLAAHRQVRRMNFRKVAVFNSFEVTDKEGRGSSIASETGDIEDAEESLLNSEEFRRGKGFFFDSWTMRSFSECGIRNVLRNNSLMKVKDEAGSAFVLYGRSRSAERFDQVNFVWGDGKLLKKLLSQLAIDAKDLQTLLPKSGKLTRSMIAAGFKKVGEMILYERLEM
ncbi:MAG: GNAT family N-acetyltransferase [Conexivisphaerales archaeon]